MKYLIVGLGNIGAEYANTRHNIGFIVLDALAYDAKASFSSSRYADTTKIKYRGRTLVLVKPNTYMNLSGKAVRYWMKQEKIPLDKIIIIVDDVALPLGNIRIKSKGGDGGHNGLIDIIYHLETTDFSRLRFGIGDDFAKGTQVNYVLGKWTKQEEELLLPKIKTATDAVKSFVSIGVEQTMNMFNQ